jgi:RND family efflux transporter MFP subunit
MSTGKSNTLVWVITIAVVAGGAYWLGGRGTHSTISPAAVDAGATATATTERKLLYYRNPMGLPDTSPTPKKDSMGMDYIAVYAGEESQASDEPGTVSISPAKIQKLGVRSEAVARRSLAQEIQAVGRIEIDERRLVTVAPRFEGWIERLHVNTTGQLVSKGQPLFDAYSPELVSAQREYQTAVQGVARLKEASPEAQAGMQQLAEAALARMKNWELSGEQLKQLAADPGKGASAGGSTVRRTLSFNAPASGVVLEKKAVQGMRFMPGEMLYQIADVSQVWVIADVFERDIGQVRVGQGAMVRVNALAGQQFAGRVDYIYPTLNAATRTVPVRVQLANPQGVLRPAMYTNVALGVDAGGTALSVPISAVIDSGTRQTVLLVKGEGRFAPREVQLGQRGESHVEVKAGLAEGDMVVTSANFLIDSESQLKAAFTGLSSAPKAAEASVVKALHKAVGVVDSINADEGTLTISHEPVPSLKWPSMTMDFVPRDKKLLKQLKPGAALEFEFGEGKPGEWVITQWQAKPAKKVN